MKSLSVCFIVKDEELVLDRILSQVSKFADEIIVVDTISHDDTVKIAKKYTDKVFEFEWVNDFSKARNYSISKATSDYFMWLDADDYIDDKSIQKLIDLKAKIKDEDVIMLPYEIAFDENGKSTFSYYRERILKNNGKFQFVDAIHEVIIPRGNIKRYDIPIKHKKVKPSDPKRNLNMYLALKEGGVKFNPRQQFYFATEYYYNNMFDKAIQEYDIFLKMNGFKENTIQAYLNLSRIYTIKKEYDTALKYAYLSFLHSTPRSEILCQIGYIYLTKKEYRTSIYWYKLAIQKPNLASGAFVELDYYDFIPYVQIGLCYYYLKEFKKAMRYNDKALKLKPNSSIVLHNSSLYQALINFNKS